MANPAESPEQLLRVARCAEPSATAGRAAELAWICHNPIVAVSRGQRAGDSFHRGGRPWKETRCLKSLVGKGLMHAGRFLSALLPL
jgi:hypothetical protein